MRRFSATVLCSYFAVVALVVAYNTPPARAAGQSAPRYEVTMQISSTYSSGPFSGSASVTADVALSGSEDATTLSGTAPVTWSGVQYQSSDPDCTLTAAGTSGSFNVTVVKQGETLNVTWGGDAASQAHLQCSVGGVDTTMPIIQPFQNTEPSTFTVPAAGGTQQVSGSYHTGQSRQDDHTGTITITGKSPCSTKASEITDVSTPNDEPTSLSALKGTNVSPGQVIATGSEQVELTFGDGSIIRLDSNSKLSIVDCKEPAGPAPPTTFNEEFGLFLGSMWAKVTKAVGANQSSDQIHTERVVCGNRGTIFWITDTRKATTLHVDKDSMWIQGLRGGHAYGKRWIVKAGQTATWKQGATKPVIRRGGPYYPAGLRPFTAN